MDTEFMFALYVFCYDYHSGQWSRGYRIMSRFHGPHYRIKVTDSLIAEMRESEHYAHLVAKYAGRV